MGSAQQLFNDLLTLETNTVVKAGMTASKMPKPAEAIVGTVANYVNYLVPLADGVANDALTADVLGVDGNIVTAASLDKVNELANVTVLATQNKLHGGDPRVEVLSENLVLLRRIANNTQQLKEMLGGQTVTAGSEVTLDPDQITRLRKIWDIGLERVVLQSVMQIDGDYITRVPSTTYLDDHGALLDLHQAMVGQSVDHYGSLIRAVSDLLKSSLSAFFRD